MTGRELRVWHYRRILALKEYGLRFPSRVNPYHGQIAFHTQAVEVLNLHPDCALAGTSAETDDIIFPQIKMRKT